MVQMEGKNERKTKMGNGFANSFKYDHYHLKQPTKYYSRPSIIYQKNKRDVRTYVRDKQRIRQ